MKTNRSKFLNLSQDLMFKTYFSKNKEVLKSLLNAFLPLPPNQKVQDISFIGDKKALDSLVDEETLTLLDSSLYPSLADNKQIILDLRIRLSTGETVNVEIQSVLKIGFLKRVLFYWSRLYTESLKKSADYSSICPAYSLIFTDFDVLPVKKYRDFINSFSLRSDKEPHYSLIDDEKIVFVELSKFMRARTESLQDIVDLCDLWCYLLKESCHIDKKEWDILSTSKGEEMRRAMEHLKDLSQDEDLRREEEAREKFLRDQRAEKAYAFNKGMEKGREQGMEKGLKTGMEKGLKTGMEQIALNMLQKNMQISDIIEITGVSAEKIKELQESVKL